MNNISFSEPPQEMNFNQHEGFLMNPSYWGDFDKKKARGTLQPQRQTYEYNSGTSSLYKSNNSKNSKSALQTMQEEFVDEKFLEVPTPKKDGADVGVVGLKNA